MESNWISVKERLPIRGKTVEVRFNDNNQTLATLIHNDWLTKEGKVVDWAGYYEPTEDLKITHWKEI